MGRPKLKRNKRGGRKNVVSKPDEVSNEMDLDCKDQSVLNEKPLTADGLKNRLDVFESRSMISSKSLGFQLKKKEKQKLRHEFLIHKLSSTSKSVTKKKKKKKKLKTVDLKDLEDTIPTLELLMKDNPINTQFKSKKPRNNRPQKAQQKAMMEDIAVFKRVASNPDFRSDPTGMIKNILMQKLMDEAL